jgi:cell division protein FtsW
MSAVSRAPAPAPAMRTDYVLLGIAALLTIIGLVTVWSASFVIGIVRFGDPNAYLIRQLIGAALGMFVLCFLWRTDYRRLRHFALPIMVLTIIALVGVLMIGEERNGARRWIGTGSLSLQPAEFAKLSLTIYLAAWLARPGRDLRSWQDGFIPFVIITGLVAGLIVAERSLGTTLVIVAIALCMFFVAGASWTHIAALGGIGLVAVVPLALMVDYRSDRLLTFLGHGELDGARFQTYQAMLALGNGGLTGLGLGASRGKFFYIPESHTDGVFAVLGEETGVIMAGFVLLLYVFLFVRGFRLAMRCKDSFGAYIATGITTWIAVQTVLNIGGITSVMPLTGVPLPFMSYGNNALAAVLMAVGVLASISRFGTGRQPEPELPPGAPPRGRVVRRRGASP